ncbi:hypothetical protein L1987_00834 [Smallanthus sonchifolius]|uniref:Uncharacterized protein n=1 Tax=Smallanthus sonchifolius TaxID=185202 RepID=A0ACB9K3E4_9ASTR|nr:hypothetical protein L1987_00834 [Smallanthus sonchifolius]
MLSACLFIGILEMMMAMAVCKKTQNANNRWGKTIVLLLGALNEEKGRMRKLCYSLALIQNNLLLCIAWLGHMGIQNRGRVQPPQGGHTVPYVSHLQQFTQTSKEWSSNQQMGEKSEVIAGCRNQVSPKEIKSQVYSYCRNQNYSIDVHAIEDEVDQDDESRAALKRWALIVEMSVAWHPGPWLTRPRSGPEPKRTIRV